MFNRRRERKDKSIKLKTEIPTIVVICRGIFKFESDALTANSVDIRSAKYTNGCLLGLRF